LQLAEAREILGDDPQKEYRRLAALYHPDKGGDPDDFHRIRDAYETLTKEATTAEHDLLAQLFLQELDVARVFTCLNTMETAYLATIASLPAKRFKLEQARPKAKGFLVGVLESAVRDLEEERRVAQNSITEIARARDLLNDLYTDTIK